MLADAVLRLEYSAYAPMADAEFARIIAEAEEAMACPGRGGTPEQVRSRWVM